MVITFHLHNRRERFSYKVGRREKKRVEKYFEDLKSGKHTKDFIVFETADSAITVIVRGREVDFSGGPGVISPGPFPFSLRAYLRDKQDPLYALVHDPADAAWFVTALDSEPMPVPLFWPALDAQRELVTLASADILLAEVASAIVEAGLHP